MADVTLSKIAGKYRHLYSQVFSRHVDLFGVWRVEIDLVHLTRLLRTKTFYFHMESEAIRFISVNTDRLQRSGWAETSEILESDQSLEMSATFKDLISYSSRCALELEYRLRQRDILLKHDVASLVETIGHAFRTRQKARPRRLGPQLELGISANVSVDRFISKRTAELFAGLMAYSLGGSGIAFDIAQRNQRDRAIEDRHSNIVTIVPKWSYSRLNLAVDDFFCGDERLSRLCFTRLLPANIQNVGDLVKLSSKQLLKILGNDTENFARLQAALRREGLQLAGNTLSKDAEAYITRKAAP